MRFSVELTTTAEYSTEVEVSEDEVLEVLREDEVPEDEITPELIQETAMELAEDRAYEQRVREGDWTVWGDTREATVAPLD